MYCNFIYLFCIQNDTLKNEKESTSTLNATVSNHSRSKKINDLNNAPRLNYNSSKKFTKNFHKRQKRQTPRTCIVNKCSLVSLSLFIHILINYLNFVLIQLNVKLFSQCLIISQCKKENKDTSELSKILKMKNISMKSIKILSKGNKRSN